MLISRNNKQKLGRHDKIIYASLFVILAFGIIIAFVYSVKFIGQALNATFSSDGLEVVEEKYGQLRLDKYSLVAKKLGLVNNNQEQAESIPSPKTETEAEEDFSLEPIMGTSSLEISDEISAESGVNPTDEEDGLPVAIIPEVSPIITVINSTQTSGLAAELRSRLQAEGFNVKNIGSSQENLPRTLIKAKANYLSGSQYFSEIKKIVSLQYDYETSLLEDKVIHDIEIVIGNQ